jgi:hypothetical protein
MSYNSNLKFKIRKWIKFGDLSPSQQSIPSEVTGRGPSTDPSRTIRDRLISRAEAVRVSLSTLIPLSPSHCTRQKVTLVDCERTVKRTCAQIVREIARSSSTMSPSRYFKISRTLSNLLKFGDSSDFLSYLELGSGFTNLIGEIASVTHCEYCAKI